MNEIAVKEEQPIVKVEEQDIVDLKPKNIIYHGDNQYRISAREKWVADRYMQMVLEGKVNYSQIGRELKERFKGRFIRGQYIRYWVERSRTGTYILDKLKEKLKAKEFDMDRWKAMGIDVLENKIEMSQNQITVWKELGKAVGVGEQAPVQFNQQINFTQSDGTV